MGWRNLRPYFDEDSDSERWVLEYLDAEGNRMQQGIGFTRTAAALPFTREFIDKKKAEHEARIISEGGVIL